MTKQEEIREGIDMTLSRLQRGFSSISEAKKELSDLGVVIKVDRELPENPYSDDDEEYGYKNGYALALYKIKNDGYVAWKPLLEVER